MSQSLAFLFSNNMSQSKAFLFFNILYYFFLYSTSFCFSSSKRFLYRLQLYCRFLFLLFIFSLILFFNWLINYIPEFVKKRWVVLKTKLWVFLKQIQPRIIVNQHVSRMCIKVQRNRENQKWKKQSEHEIITAIKALRDIKNLLGKSR